MGLFFVEIANLINEMWPYPEWKIGAVTLIGLLCAIGIGFAVYEGRMG